MSDEAVLAAFRQVTGWTDAEVLHYAECDACTPICGHEEYACNASPQRMAAAGSVGAGEDGTVTP